MVENVFHRQIGAYYVGFILLTLLINKHSENEKEVIKGGNPLANCIFAQLLKP